jgi:serine/threonine-protein kinase
MLLGKYRIERVIGMGGMGVVVSATHVQLDERVAIKFLLPNAMANEEVVTRFMREARAAAKIRSEHVARVSDVGTMETGEPYMVMEFLQGQDVAELLRVRRQLPPSEAVEHVMQACEALAEAHALGIVHRDLKPANLFVAQRADGGTTIKVLDFGISKLSAGIGAVVDNSLTTTQAVLGSPLYMSPEQMKASRDVDGRSDLWSMGVTLYEMVTGRPPFDGETVTALCAQVFQESPPEIGPLAPDCPAGLQAVIMRCLQKAPGDRFANVAELTAALAPFAPPSAYVSVQRTANVLLKAGVAVDVPPPRSSVDGGLATASTAWDAARELTATPVASKRSPAPMIAAIVAAMAVAAMIAAWAVGGASKVTPTAPPPPARASFDNPAPAAPSSSVTVTPAEPSATVMPSASSPAVARPSATVATPKKAPAKRSGGDPDVGY